MFINYSYKFIKNIKFSQNVSVHEIANSASIQMNFQFSHRAEYDKIL